MRNKQITKLRPVSLPLLLVICYLLFVICSCDEGQIGDADKTESHDSGNGLFEERLNFLNGVWHSGYPGKGWLDSYRIRQWGSLTDEDKSFRSRL